MRGEGSPLTNREDDINKNNLSDDYSSNSSKAALLSCLEVQES